MAQFRPNGRKRREREGRGQRDHGPPLAFVFPGWGTRPGRLLVCGRMREGQRSGLEHGLRHGQRRPHSQAAKMGRRKGQGRHVAGRQIREQFAPFVRRPCLSGVLVRGDRFGPIHFRLVHFRQIRPVPIRDGRFLHPVFRGPVFRGTVLRRGAGERAALFRGGILAVSGSLVFQPLPLQGGFHFGRGSEKLGKPCVQSGGKRRGMFLQVVRACCYGMGGVAHGVRCEDGGGDADTGKRIFHCIGTGRDADAVSVAVYAARTARRTVYTVPSRLAASNAARADPVSVRPVWG